MTGESSGSAPLGTTGGRVRSATLQPPPEPTVSPDGARVMVDRWPAPRRAARGGVVQ
jgi:hypothetical protein